MTRPDRKVGPTRAARSMMIALLLCAAPLTAQRRGEDGGTRPSAVARSASDVYNATPTRRVTGAFEIARAHLVGGQAGMRRHHLGE